MDPRPHKTVPQPGSSSRKTECERSIQPIRHLHEPSIDRLTLYRGIGFSLIVDRGGIVGQITIGALAKEARVNLQTIRYYEREGLIAEPPRTSSGYRMFFPDLVGRVRFVKRAQELGFSLAEIKELLALRVDGKAGCADIRQRTQIKVEDVKNKIRSLQAIKKALERLTATCNGTGPVSECPILENLDSDEFR